MNHFNDEKTPGIIRLPTINRSIKIEKTKYISFMLEEYMKYAGKNMGKYRIEVNIFEKV